MHDHDPDLIASLAESRLGGKAAAAEESISGCEECLAELKAQHAALAAITAQPRPGLSMAESADLRRAVANAVGLAAEPEAPAARRPWLGLATAAAVVVALVAVAPLVNLLSTDSDADIATETTIAEATRDAALDQVAESIEPATTSPVAAEAPAAGAPEAGGDFNAAADGGDGLPDSYLDFGSVGQLDDFLAEVPKGITDGTTSRSLTEDEVRYYEEEFSVELEDVDLSGCSAGAAFAAVADASFVITIGRADFGGSPVVIALVTTADGLQVAVAIDAITCEVLAQVDV